MVTAFQNIKKGDTVMITTDSFPQVRMHQQQLDQGVIPAMKGEYYDYPALFSAERPMYALMDCKANKGRLLGDLALVGQEANLFFEIGVVGARLTTVKTALRKGLIEADTSGLKLDETWISPTEISVREFNEIRSRHNAEELAEISRIARPFHTASIKLETGLVIAVMTSRGKYGLIQVAGMSLPEIHIEGCHVLL